MGTSCAHRASRLVRRVTLASAVVFLGLGAGSPASAEDRTLAEVVSAGGQQQWVSCAGSGEPTVVLATDLRADASVWGSLPRALQRISRTCFYDRPGLGKSPIRADESTVTSAVHAEELHALLTEIGETAPVVLVGSGYAGNIVRSYAKQFPVGGAVLIDGVYPAIHRTFLPAYRSPWDDGVSQIDMAASEQAAKGARILADAPLIVLSTTAFEKGAPDWAQERWTTQQRKAAALSTNSLWITLPNASTRIWESSPQSVISAVRAVVASAIDGSDLECEFDWGSDSGECN